MFVSHEKVCSTWSHIGASCLFFGQDWNAQMQTYEARCGLNGHRLDAPITMVLRYHGEGLICTGQDVTPQYD